jgi:hypothetical protein
MKKLTKKFYKNFIVRGTMALLIVGLLLVNSAPIIVLADVPLEEQTVDSAGAAMSQESATADNGLLPESSESSVQTSTETAIVSGEETQDAMAAVSSEELSVADSESTEFEPEAESANSGAEDSSTASEFNSEIEEGALNEAVNESMTEQDASGDGSGATKGDEGSEASSSALVESEVESSATLEAEEGTSENTLQDTQTTNINKTSESETAEESLGPGEDGDNTADGEDGEQSGTEGSGDNASPSNGGGSTGGGNTTINTGDSVAAANVVNVVNTNIFNSNGLLLFLSNLFGNINFDLRNAFGMFDSAQDGSASQTSATSTAAGGSCALDACLSSSVNFTSYSSSSARIINDMVVRSTSGANIALSPDGTAIINSGDAFAAGNLINVANTNFIDSNYLLISLNNFGDMFGDLVLPGASFFEQFFSRKNSLSASTTVENTNLASVLNAGDTQAISGGNLASSTDSTINTGAAEAHSSTINQLNQNFFGADSLVIMLRVWGDWRGEIFSAPEGLRWHNNGDGSLSLMFSGNDSAASSTSTQGGTGGELSLASSLIQNNSAAEILNNMQIMALTGDNYAESGAANGAAIINSGNAYAASSIVNVANTNVIGSNWLLAMINIFGDWQGNIAFGRPDLWVGAVAETPGSPMRPGDNIGFKVTVANRGDAIARDVKLKLLSDWSLMWVNGGRDLGDGGREWEVGDIGPGEAEEVHIEAEVRDIVAPGEKVFEPVFSVSAQEPDNNTDDNTDRIALAVKSESAVISNGPSIYYTPPSKLVLEKINSAPTPIFAPSTVDYTITIRNEGIGPAYYAELIDTLRGHNGDVLNEERWPLDTIYPGEEITVTYTTEYSAGTIPGVYSNKAYVKAYDGHTSLQPFYASPADSNMAESMIEILPEPIAEKSAEVEETPAEEVAQEESVKEQAIEQPVIEQSTALKGDEGSSNDHDIIGMGGEGLPDENIAVPAESRTIKVISSEQKREQKEFMPVGEVDEGSSQEVDSIVMKADEKAGTLTQLAAVVKSIDFRFSLYVLIGSGAIILIMYLLSFARIPRFPIF